MKIDVEYFDALSTITKTRYIVGNPKRDTIEKIFSLNNLSDKDCYEGNVESRMLEKISGIIGDFDLVVLADFGHGLVTPRIMKLVQEKAKILALNCQTNSTNYGYNLITKYNRADLISLDQREINLAFADNVSPDEKLLGKLWEAFSRKRVFLTRGAHGAAVVSENGDITKCPAFTLTVKDTVGAGDAFFSVASLCLATNLGVDISVFLANVTAALATKIVGNKTAVSKVDMLKYVATLLNV